MSSRWRDRKGALVSSAEQQARRKALLAPVQRYRRAWVQLVPESPCKVLKWVPRDTPIGATGGGGVIVDSFFEDSNVIEASTDDEDGEEEAEEDDSDGQAHSNQGGLNGSHEANEGVEGSEAKPSTPIEPDPQFEPLPTELESDPTPEKIEIDKPLDHHSREEESQQGDSQTGSQSLQDSKRATIPDVEMAENRDDQAEEHVQSYASDHDQPTHSAAVDISQKMPSNLHDGPDVHLSDEVDKTTSSALLDTMPAQETSSQPPNGSDKPIQQPPQATSDLRLQEEDLSDVKD